MRIWDLEVQRLCRRHLLGEHNELHGLWTVLTQDRPGYANHPETRRWRGRLAALYRRHEEQVAEMTRRGFHHQSPLDPALASGDANQTETVDDLASQIANLRAKGCDCQITDLLHSSTGSADQPARP